MSDLNKIIKYLKQVEKEYPNAMKLEFFGFLEVLKAGAKKHGLNNWTQADGKGIDHNSNHASMFRHLAASQLGQRIDNGAGGSNRDHLENLMCRAAFQLYRMQQQIIAEKDVERDAVYYTVHERADLKLNIEE